MYHLQATVGIAMAVYIHRKHKKTKLAPSASHAIKPSSSSSLSHQIGYGGAAVAAVAATGYASSVAYNHHQQSAVPTSMAAGMMSGGMARPQLRDAGEIYHHLVEGVGLPLSDMTSKTLRSAYRS